ncbi:hypothetical protein B0H11DRAFT_2153410 [Mycena galericulata]|nr:hypothetical protein B0H11DRAFT_2153410 [Mycena galericulata]
MDAKLAQVRGVGQKEQGAAFIALIHEILARTDQAAVVPDLHALVDTVVNHDSVGLVVGRQVLSELVKILGEGVVKNPELRKTLVEDTLATIQPRIVSYEEQVNVLRFQLADILEEEEEWSEAARVLMGTSLDSGQRAMPEGDKLRVYVRIVRLLLEDEDSIQAETYYNRAALLVHSTSDKETLLQFKLCQARISDYGRKFLEAASRYHELSYVGDIDEEERRQMLSAHFRRSRPLQCAVLAPAGPNRSRVLASLYRDERTIDLPTYNILSKMFLDHILRFRRTAASTRTGPSTVLDRAVMEHNLLASSKIYNNITFRGLGALLDLTPGAAETMARKMIEQGRLRGSIDPAGGLGDVEEAEDTGAPFTKRWDNQIRLTAG